MSPPIFPFANGKLARFLCLMAVFTLTSLSPVHGGVKWTITGPEGGQVKCLASPDATGTIVYAGCNGGVFKSTDAGEHWQPLPGSPPNVTRLAVNPLNPNVVYAGWDNGVSRSTDGGSTWQLCFNSSYGAGLGGRIPTGLVVGPDNRVYATFNNTVGDHGPFCVSTDGGQTWSETRPPGYVQGLPTPTYFVTIDFLAVDPFQSGIIYLVANGWYWRSQDYGQTFWHIPYGNGGNNIYAEPDAQGVLYSYGGSYGLYRSNDWGDTWFSTFSPSYCQAVISHQGIGWAVLAANFNGVSRGYSSPFSPDVWTDFNHGLSDDARSSISALLLHTPYGAFAATALGVYRTDTINFSGDWRPKNQGLINATITCLAVDPLHVLYAGTDGQGIFKSTDRGATWQAINNGITAGPTLKVNAISVDPHNYFLVYAATNQGLYRSLDRGATWLPTSFTYLATSVLADPNLPGTVFTIAGDSYSSGGTWFSNDGGATWHPLGSTPGGGSTLVCGATDFPLYTVNYNAISKLDTAVSPWQQLTSLPTGVTGVSMAVDPRAPNILYVGTYKDGLYKSVNGGASWNQVTSPPFNFTPQRPVAAITVDLVNSDVYVGLQNGTWTTNYSDPDYPSTMNSGGLWKSSDGGTAWTDLGVPQYRGVNSIALVSGTPSIYCGLANAGVAVNSTLKTNIAPILLLLED